MNRSALPVLAVALIGLTACGGSDSSDETDTSEAPEASAAVSDPPDEFTEDTEAADTTPATDPPATEAADTTPATDPPATEAADTTPATDAPVAETQPEVTEGAAAGSEVSLEEWSIGAPTEFAAGEVTFTAINNGRFPHELVVIQGEGYESLPLADGGAVIEDDLPTGALLGRTSRIAGGESEDLTVSLAPGNYVLVCNLGAGGNSHAGQGQRLDITVT